MRALAITLAAGALALAACTPAQVQDAKTALTVNQCVTTVVLRHVEDDLKAPTTLAVLGNELAAECIPQKAPAP